MAADQVSGDDVADWIRARAIRHRWPTTLDQILPCSASSVSAGDALEQNLAVGDDGHAGAEFADVVHDVGGEDDGDIRGRWNSAD